MKSRFPKNFDELRIKVIFYAFALVCGVFVLRLFQIQLLQHKKYSVMAQDQYLSYASLPAKRGVIYSADGFPLAATQVAYLLYVEPKKSINPEVDAYNLTKNLVEAKVVVQEDFDAWLASIKDKLTSSKIFWAPIAHQLTPNQRESLELNKNLNFIGFEEEAIRYYPEDTLASHVLGFIAKDEAGDVKGYFGIEGSMDGDLKGRSGRVVEERDALGNPILLGGYKKIDPIDGRNVILTLNRAVQHLVEKHLQEGVQKYGAVSGSVIVMDPVSGDVIALANYPTYHPNKFDDFAEQPEETEYKFERRNLAIAETYEPGSVIKALTVSAGIDLGKIVPTTTYQDNGPVEYSDYTIDNWDGKHHGQMNIIQLLQKSNNIGSAWVGHLLGTKNLYKYFTAFGFGVVTGISLEGEDSGTMRDPNEWTDIDLATAAFGQGISATPLQVLNAFNTIANGGLLMQPRIVSQIIDEHKTLDLPVKSIRRVMSKKSADTVSDMLVQAVEGGESKFFNIKNYLIAGKTGTAQIPVNGKYDPQKTNATFVGYLANSKKFSMIVRLDRPETSVYAAETAVPLWMSIASDLVTLYSIPPDIK